MKGMMCVEAVSVERFAEVAPKCLCRTKEVVWTGALLCGQLVEKKSDEGGCDHCLIISER